MDDSATRRWRVGHGCSIKLGRGSVIMGVLNVTPDSFSDAGRFMSLDAAVARAKGMAAEGAAIIDIGGESTRPGAEPVTAVEEQRRVLPVIEALAGTGPILSVDTYRAETARLAIEAGAHIVNDVWGAQREPAIARVAAETGAGLCLMHTGRERDLLPDPIEDQVAFLDRSVVIARKAGVSDDAIVLDPGFGFGKGAELNLELMRRFSELRRRVGFPWLVGTSRKRFVRAAVGDDGDTDIGTAATSVLLRERGASIFRVHEIAVNRDALAVADAMLEARR